MVWALTKTSRIWVGEIVTPHKVSPTLRKWIACQKWVNYKGAHECLILPWKFIQAFTLCLFPVGTWKLFYLFSFIWSLVIDPPLLGCFDREDPQDLSVKVKSKLNLSLRSLLEPLSLERIIMTWDFCARSVLSEYAQQNGGGSFSSKYGTWENCLSAAWIILQDPCLYAWSQRWWIKLYLPIV